MAINKVVFGSSTLIDITDTTATAGTILSGYGAYGADGVWIDGTASADGIVTEDVANATGTTCAITGTNISPMHMDYALSIEAFDGYDVSADYAASLIAIGGE